MNEYRTPADSMTVLTERAVVVVAVPDMPAELKHHHAEDIRKSGGPGTIVIIGPCVILDEDVEVKTVDEAETLGGLVEPCAGCEVTDPTPERPVMFQDGRVAFPRAYSPPCPECGTPMISGNCYCWICKKPRVPKAENITVPCKWCEEPLPMLRTRATLDHPLEGHYEYNYYFCADCQEVDKLAESNYTVVRLQPMDKDVLDHYLATGVLPGMEVSL